MQGRANHFHQLQCYKQRHTHVHESVFKLDVPVGHPLLVAVVYCQRQLLEEPTRHRLLQVPKAPHVRVQCACSRILQHDADEAAGDKHVSELDDVGVPHQAVVHNLSLHILGDLGQCNQLSDFTAGMQLCIPWQHELGSSCLVSSAAADLAAADTTAPGPTCPRAHLRAWKKLDGNNLVVFQVACLDYTAEGALPQHFDTLKPPILFQGCLDHVRRAICRLFHLSVAQSVQAGADDRSGSSRQQLLHFEYFTTVILCWSHSWVR